jgi:hypothetical protein
VPLPGGLGGDLHGNGVEPFIIAFGVTSDQGLNVIRCGHAAASPLVTSIGSGR